MSRVYSIELSEESIVLLKSGLICMDAIRELSAEKKKQVEYLIEMFNTELVYG